MLGAELLRPRQRELEESSRTEHGEARTTNEERPMFEEDFASTGHFSVADLRKKLRGLPGNAVVHLSMEGYTPSPITNFEFEKPAHPDEGEVGAVMLSMDPSGEIGRMLVDQEPIKTKFVQTITVIDPDSKLPVEVEIRKLENGGMVGIDGSWLEADEGPVYSPFVSPFKEPFCHIGESWCLSCSDHESDLQASLCQAVRILITGLPSCPMTCPTTSLTRSETLNSMLG